MPGTLPTGVGQIPRWPRTYCEARDRWLVKPIRTTRKIQTGWIDSHAQSVWPGVRSECPHRRSCTGRMATSARMTLGQESIASDAESYQRGSWRRPDPRITAGLVATACALLPIRFRPRSGFERARRPPTSDLEPAPVAHAIIWKRNTLRAPTQR